MHKILIELEPEVEKAIRQEGGERQMSVSGVASYVFNTIVKAYIKIKRGQNEQTADNT